MSLKEIFNDNLQCIWDNKLLIKKNIEVENNTPDEILEVTKEFLNKEKISPKNILSKLESNNIKFNYLNHSILRSLSRYFLEKNKILN